MGKIIKIEKNYYFLPQDNFHSTKSKLKKIKDKKIEISIWTLDRKILEKSNNISYYFDDVVLNTETMKEEEIKLDNNNIKRYFYDQTKLLKLKTYWFERLKTKMKNISYLVFKNKMETKENITLLGKILFNYYDDKTEKKMFDNYFRNFVIQDKFLETIIFKPLLFLKKENKIIILLNNNFIENYNSFKNIRKELKNNFVIENNLFITLQELEDLERIKQNKRGLLNTKLEIKEIIENINTYHLDKTSKVLYAYNNYYKKLEWETQEETKKIQEYFIKKIRKHFPHIIYNKKNTIKDYVNVSVEEMIKEKYLQILKHYYFNYFYAIKIDFEEKKLLSFSFNSKNEKKELTAKIFNVLKNTIKQVQNNSKISYDKEIEKFLKEDVEFFNEQFYVIFEWYVELLKKKNLTEEEQKEKQRLKTMIEKNLPNFEDTLIKVKSIFKDHKNFVVKSFYEKIIIKKYSKKEKKDILLLLKKLDANLNKNFNNNIKNKILLFFNP